MAIASVRERGPALAQTSSPGSNPSAIPVSGARAVAIIKAFKSILKECHIMKDDVFRSGQFPQSASVRKQKKTSAALLVAVLILSASLCVTAAKAVGEIKTTDGDLAREFNTRVAQSDQTKKGDGYSGNAQSDQLIKTLNGLTTGVTTTTVTQTQNGVTTTTVTQTKNGVVVGTLVTETKNGVTVSEHLNGEIVTSTTENGVTTTTVIEGKNGVIVTTITETNPNNGITTTTVIEEKNGVIVTTVTETKDGKTVHETVTRSDQTKSADLKTRSSGKGVTFNPYGAHNKGVSTPVPSIHTASPAAHPPSPSVSEHAPTVNGRAR